MSNDERQPKISSETPTVTGSYTSSAADFDSPEDPLIGKVVAQRYRVIEKMGEGGMGTVYLAEHVTIEKKIALKVLLQEYARKADLKERFLREAKAAASIGHENIIDITDFGETPDRSVFFAMEFLDGCDLSQEIKKEGPLPWSRAKPILLQICRALGAAHSKEIIHRDMKPENVYLIEREGRGDFVKVLDFGIAKVSSATDGEHRLTRTGMIFGTPEYMSPEQAQGHLPDHRVDIYAVGVIMYELLTGEVPFRADTFMGILTKHIFEKPVPPTELKPKLNVPIGAEEIIIKALAKDRDDRFSSMTEMSAAIQAVSTRTTRSTSDMAPARKITPAGGTEVAASIEARTVTGVPAKAVKPVVSVETEVPQNRGKMIAIAAAAVVVIGGGIAAAVALGGGSKGATSGAGTGSAVQPATGTGGPVESAEKVSLTLKSTPGGAQVYKGNELIGITPTSVELPKSSRSVMFTFRLGDKQEKKAVVPDGAKDVSVAFAGAAVARKDAGVTAARPKTKRSGRTKTKTRPGTKIRIVKTKSTKVKPDTKVDKTDLKDPFAKKK